MSKLMSFEEFMGGGSAQSTPAQAPMDNAPDDNEDDDEEGLGTEFDQERVSNIGQIQGELGRRGLNPMQRGVLQEELGKEQALAGSPQARLDAIQERAKYDRATGKTAPLSYQNGTAGGKTMSFEDFMSGGKASQGPTGPAARQAAMPDLGPTIAEAMSGRAGEVTPPGPTPTGPISTGNPFTDWYRKAKDVEDNIKSKVKDWGLATAATSAGILDMFAGILGMGIQSGAYFGARGVAGLMGEPQSIQAKMAKEISHDLTPDWLSGPFRTLMGALGHGEAYDESGVSKTMGWLTENIEKGSQWMAEKTGHIMQPEDYEQLANMAMLVLGTKGGHAAMTKALTNKYDLEKTYDARAEHFKKYEMPKTEPTFETPKNPAQLAEAHQQGLQGPGLTKDAKRFYWRKADQKAAEEFPEDQAYGEYVEGLREQRGMRPGGPAGPSGPGGEPPAGGPPAQGRATWRNGDVDTPVEVLDRVGEQGGERYVRVKDAQGNEGVVPESQLLRPDIPWDTPGTGGRRQPVPGKPHIRLRSVTEPTEPVADYLDNPNYFYHAVRNDADVASIMKGGLKAGSNVSDKTIGQAFEGEGATVLVFNKGDYRLGKKRYQDDLTVQGGAGRPVAILKDTSTGVRESGATYAERAEKAYNDYLQERGGLAKELGMTPEDLESLIVQTEGRGPHTNDARARLGESFDRVRKLGRKQDEAFKLVEKADDQPARTAADVLGEYKQHGLPVHEFKSVYDDATGKSTVSLVKGAPDIPRLSEGLTNKLNEQGGIDPDLLKKAGLASAVVAAGGWAYMHPEDVEKIGRKALEAAGAIGQGLKELGPAALATFIPLAKTHPKIQLAERRIQEGIAKRAPPEQVREQIWKDLRVFKTTDGIWRTELDPSKSYLKVGKLEPGMKLEDILHFPELFEKVPSARGLSVERYADPGESRAGYRHGARKILMSDKAFQEGTALSSLHHEIQHHVQREHQMARGGNEKEFLTPEEKKFLENVDRETINMIPATDRMPFDQLYKAAKNYMEKPKTPETLEATRKVFEPFKGDPEWPQILKHLENLVKADHIKKRIGFDYTRLGGEVEARAVQRRLKMTDEQRANIPPWKSFDLPEEAWLTKTKGPGEAEWVKQKGGVWHPDAVGRLSNELESGLITGEEFARSAISGLVANPELYAKGKAKVEWAREAIRRYLGKYAGTADDPLKDVPIPNVQRQGTIPWEQAMDSLIQSRPARDYARYEVMQTENFEHYAVYDGVKKVSPTFKTVDEAREWKREHQPPEDFRRMDPEAPVWEIDRGWNTGEDPSYGNRKSLNEFLRHVGEYVNEFVPLDKLPKYSFDQAVRETAAMDARLRERAEREAAKANQITNKDLPTYKDFGDGVRWIELKIPDKLTPDQEKLVRQQTKGEWLDSVGLKESVDRGTGRDTYEWLKENNKLPWIGLDGQGKQVKSQWGGPAVGRTPQEAWFAAQVGMESNKMGHSVGGYGKEGGYGLRNNGIQAIRDGDVRLLSLRDKAGKSRITVEIEKYSPETEGTLFYETNRDVLNQPRFRDQHDRINETSSSPGEYVRALKSMLDDAGVEYKTPPAPRKLEAIAQVKGEGNSGVDEMFWKYGHDLIKSKKWGYISDDVQNIGLWNFHPKLTARSGFPIKTYVGPSEVNLKRGVYTKQEMIDAIHAAEEVKWKKLEEAKRIFRVSKYGARLQEWLADLENPGKAGWEKVLNEDVTKDRWPVGEMNWSITDLADALKNPIKDAKTADRILAATEQIRKEGQGPKPPRQEGKADVPFLIKGAAIAAGAAIGGYVNPDTLTGAALGAMAVGLGVGLPYKGLGKAAKYGLGILSTEIGNISKPLLKRARDYELDVLRTGYGWLKASDPFLVRLNKLGKEDQATLERAILSNDQAAIRQAFLDIGDSRLTREWPRVQQVLAQMGGQLAGQQRYAGITRGEFPLAVKDLEGLLGKLNVPVRTALENELKAAGDKSMRMRGVGLSTMEESAIINKHVQGMIHAAGRGRGGQMAPTVAAITADLQPFYHTATESLHAAIRNAAEDLAKARFFGRDLATTRSGSQKHINIQGSIGNLVQRELAQGNIKPTDVERLIGLLESRFKAGEINPSPIVQGAKNYAYMGLLANPVAAATQLGDPFISMALHGTRNTLVGMVRTLTGNARVRMSDFGMVDHIAEEFTSVLKSARTLNRMMKISGFSAMDTFGKTVTLNAAFDKLQRWSETAKGQKRIAEKYGEMFGQELPDLIRDLHKGAMTDRVRSALFNELSNLQPLTRLEMPQGYLDAGKIWGGAPRVAYMLKSFMLKQLDVIRTEGWNDIKAGHRARGLYNMGKILVALGMAGATTDMLKDFIMGRPFDAKWQDIPMNMLKTFGWSEYVLDKMRGARGKAEPFSTVAGMAGPPFKMMDEIIMQDPKAIKYIPLAGRMWYEHFMGGAEDAARWKALRQATEEGDKFKARQIRREQSAAKKAREAR